jgi:N-acetylmuramoyl-L-alanine amidase
MSQLLLDGKYLWEKKSTYLWCLDPGHGSVDKNGVYTTAPAKMFKHADFTIYEGKVNHDITELVRLGLHAAGIDYAVVADDVEDTSLEQRVVTADNIYKKDKRAVYLSIHSNAGGGNGLEIFTAPGQSDSDSIAQIFAQVYQKRLSKFKWRGLKENNFYVLRKTDCPAILVENLFFDDLEEAKYLNSVAGQKEIAATIIESIMMCEQLKPI